MLVDNGLSKTGTKTVLIDCRIIEFNKQQFINNKSNKDIDLYEKIKIKTNGYNENWNKYNSDKQLYMKNISKTLDKAVYGLY